MRLSEPALLLTMVASAGGQSRPAVVSPEVLPDHRVTFRLLAPKAQEVTFTGDWITGSGPKLVKGEDGVWSLTLGPLAPASYIYSYTVDDVAIADPVNPRIKLRARGSGSLFDVTATPPAVWQAADVPHGAVEINWQASPVLGGETRAIWVYTPPGYTAERDRRYPVLYLLHGSNDTAAGWTIAGDVNFIFDNLIAAKKMVPMVVVMPFGHALPFGSGRGSADNTSLFEQYLLKEVIPGMEAKYRTLPGRERRALAGLSMGGEQSLAIGMGHLELFSAIGAFSPSVPRGYAESWAPLLADAAGTNQKLKALWIACGRQDPSHMNPSRTLAETLKQHGIHYQYVETEGAHNFALWQQHIAQFAPLLFRENATP